MTLRFDLFFGTFATLLAVINPLEALPVFIALTASHDEASQRAIARRSCIYAVSLMVFFLLFGTLMMRFFGVPLSMVRVVGGIILTRIGFSLFLPTPGTSLIPSSSSSANAGDSAFVPMAMPIMFGPGALAAVVGMSASIKPAPDHSGAALVALLAILLAIVATMGVTYLILGSARKVLDWIGPKGIDAATRIVGFFVSAMGMGMIFHGVVNELTSELGLLPHH
jgi:multiple antibiotic resistance protein